MNNLPKKLVDKAYEILTTPTKVVQLKRDLHLPCGTILKKGEVGCLFLKKDENGCYEYTQGINYHWRDWKNALKALIPEGSFDILITSEDNGVLTIHGIEKEELEFN